MIQMSRYIWFKWVAIWHDSNELLNDMIQVSLYDMIQWVAMIWLKWVAIWFRWVAMIGSHTIQISHYDMIQMSRYDTSRMNTQTKRYNCWPNLLI